MSIQHKTDLLSAMSGLTTAAITRSVCSCWTELAIEALLISTAAMFATAENGRDARYGCKVSPKFSFSTFSSVLVNVTLRGRWIIT